jgi:phage baseplate assembly protein W
MFVRRMTSSGAIAVNGDQYVTGLEAIKYSIDRHLAELYGENFLNRSSGTPLKEIMDANVDDAERDAQIRRRIMDHPAVMQILELSVTQTDYTININAEILSNAGVINIGNTN